MPKYFMAQVVVLVLAFSLGAQAFADSGPITWKMAFLKGEVMNSVSTPLSRTIKLVAGDKFQLLIQVAGKGAYCYVVFSSADQAVTVLESGFVSANTAVTLPSEFECYEVGPPRGLEKIYVVVTDTKQSKLEQLLSDAQNNPSAIIEENIRIQQSVSTVAELPEKPVPMGGAIRGRTDNITMTQYEGQKTYVRIIRIEH